MLRLNFKKWLGLICPTCGQTRESRGLQPISIDGRRHGVECQDSYHGARTIRPGERCNDSQGNSVTMPD